jgi:hypothetical protein
MMEFRGVLRRSGSVLALAVCVGGGATRAIGQSVSLVTDRARVAVASIPDAMGGSALLKVLRTDSGTPLRAGTAWIWSQDWQEEPSNYYAELRGKGFNAVRIILFDTWLKEAGYQVTDWNDPTYRATALGRIERAVNLCSKNGLYAIINSHNDIPLFDVAYNQALWTQVAPYFANRTNVVYEMDNEALSGSGIGASGTYEGDPVRLQDLRNTFNIIRAGAPNTHVTVLTPAGVSSWGYVNGMATLARTFDLLGSPIDWTKTSVSHHLYHGDANLFPNAENLRNLHAQYPGWPSENNFPSTLSSTDLGITDSARSVSFGNDLYVTQTCERLGLGWSHWNMNRSDGLNHNFPFLWNDATAKGYTWSPDPVRNSVAKINAGAGTVGTFEEDINYSGGSIATNDPNATITTAGVANAAPADVYKSERWGNFTYGISRLTPNTNYSIRLHFNESYQAITAVGQRTFNVYANATKVLSLLDIYSAAGKKRNKAVVKTVTGRADANGRIVLRFESVVQMAKVNGIELLGAPN